MNILIIVDNLSIGGIQRLALDQAYQLIDNGFSCSILVLGPPPLSDYPSFENCEKELIARKKLSIKYLAGDRKMQTLKMFQVLNDRLLDSIICHSLRGGVISFVLRPLTFSKYSISTTIHQLPSFSSIIQRMKRMFYSQFTDHLFVFSLAALNDWNFERDTNFFARLISMRKKPSLCRNGVYLPRLFLNKSRSLEIRSKNRLIYIGRLTSWKGINTFLEIVESDLLIEFEILLVVPTDPSELLSKLSADTRKKISCIIGKSVNAIDFKKGDIHLYPVVNNSRFVESISINVLEMACLGVPSLITQNGSETWPELTELRFVREVQWSNLKSISHALRTIDTSFLLQNLEKVQSLVDIRENLNTILVQ